MRWALLALAVLVSGCDNLVEPPESAADCGVSEQEFREAKATMREAKPYTSRRVGECDILNDDTGSIFVSTKEEQESVNRSIAAENKN